MRKLIESSSPLKQKNNTPLARPIVQTRRTKKNRAVKDLRSVDSNLHLLLSESEATKTDRANFSSPIGMSNHVSSRKQQSDITRINVKASAKNNLQNILTIEENEKKQHIKTSPKLKFMSEEIADRSSRGSWSSRRVNTKNENIKSLMERSRGSLSKKDLDECSNTSQMKWKRSPSEKVVGTHSIMKSFQGMSSSKQSMTNNS